MKINFYLHSGFGEGEAKSSSLLSFLKSRKINVRQQKAPIKEDELGVEYLDILNVTLEHIAILVPLVIAYLDWKKTNQINSKVEADIDIPEEGIRVSLKGSEKEIIDNIKIVIKNFTKSDTDAKE